MPLCFLTAGSIDFFNDTNMPTTDGILNCCLQAMNQKYHVVLLSNDEDLLKKASVLYIHAYKFETIKDPTNKPNDVHDINTNKSNMIVSNKFLSSRSHKMFQNIPGLMGEKVVNANRPNNKSIFDDDSVTTEMTSEINRVIQTLKTQNRVLNSNEENSVQKNKNLFLFQKPCPLTLQNQTKDATNKNQYPAENKIAAQKAEMQRPNGNINVPNSNKNNIEKDNERIKHMQMSVESNLRSFCITYKAMEGTVTERMEEWTCIFTQIMENALCYVLQKSSFRADLILPWTVQEMIERLKQLYEDRLMLNVVVDKMLSCMSKCMSDRGKINPDIKAQVFIRTIGCGILLIQCLKSLQPDCEELSNAKQSLINLLRTIEHPIDIELNNTPRTSHSYVDEKRRNHIKQPSEIIRYLKQHYEDWRGYDEMQHPEPKRCNMTTDQETQKVFRISGKNLNMLQIDNKNTMTFMKCADKSETNTLECISKNPESNNLGKNTDISAGPKLLKQNKRPLESEKRDNSTIIKSHNSDNKSNLSKSNLKMPINDLDVSFNDTFDTTKCIPKVTRRVSVIEEYEKRIIRRSLDMHALDYSDINDYGNNTDNTLSNNTLRDDSNETHVIDVGNHSTNVDYGKNDSGYNNSQNTNDITNNLLISDNKKKTSNTKDSGVNKGANVVEKNYISISDYSTATPMKTCVTKTAGKKDSRKTKHDSNDSGGNKTVHTTKNDHISISDSSINNTNDNTNNKAKNNPNVPKKTKHVKDSAKNNCDVRRKDDNDVSLSDTTSDSGIGKDSHVAYSFVKMFLSQLSCTFIKTHAFIIENMEPLREQRLSDAEKTCLHEKIGKGLKHMGDIINKLKSTIERESNENLTLYTLLSKDQEAAKDERIIRYRAVLRKCLEQAQNLQNAMKIMHSITDANWDGSLSDPAESISSSITYLNIFE
ncbi:hypothetical protein O3G_MSEX003058 [Manduca sexta]|uniref:Uncharacterized protein n=1 Tax=Manduca sexta TaxID=7130 RepID=A0A921YR57_MANSE|nr:hypothetical protein O3G_MSEX003058 [Manduca sexta]